MTGETAADRSVLEISGGDRIGFLQGLVTNDLGKLAEGPVYAALLTPQGKYLADFFLVDRGEAVLLDVKAELAPDLLKKLKMYKLRADVAIAESDLQVQRGLGPAPAHSLPDPRDPALGWRAYGEAAGAAGAGAGAEIDWDAVRVAHGVPESGIELVPGETFILEAGLERLNGVDHRKGCYVGQEVTARMHHKTELKKGLARVRVEGAAPVGTAITAAGKPVGTLYTQAGGEGLAYLRFARAGEGMAAGDARVSWAGA